MPHVALSVDRDEVKAAMRKHGALVAIWTTDWDLPGKSEWWWTCCDAPEYSIDRVESSRGRRSIKKGLRNCETRIVAVDDFVGPAYAIISEAIKGYGGTVPSEDSYRHDLEQMAAYPGTELWASFVGGEMAAFATCQIIDGAVTLGSTKSNPEFNNANANAALFYSICSHYLERGDRYVSNGWRTLWHPTAINDYLMTLGFRRIYCRVNIELAPAVRLVDATRIGDWGRHVGLEKILGNRWLQIEGVRNLVRIAGSFT